MSTIQWHIRDNYKNLEQFLQSDEWTKTAELVKRNQRRSVYRLNVPTCDKIIFIKHDHPKSLRNRVKSLWRYKGQDEYKTAVELQRRGVLTVPLIGWGEKDPDSYLVTENVSSAGSLEDVWELVKSRAASRDDFVENIAQFVGSLFRAGVMHYDLHPENMIIRRLRKSFDFCLVDFSNITLVSELTVVQRYPLIAWLRDFLGHLKKSEQAAILDAVHLLNPGVDLIHIRRTIIRYTASKSHESWSSRRKYYLGRSKKCQILQTANGKWVLLRPFSIDSAQSIIDTYLREKGATHQPLKNVQILKRRVKVAGHFYIVQEFINSDRILFTKPDRQYWLMSHRLHTYGIPVVQPLVWFKRRLSSSIVILPDIEGTTLNKALTDAPAHARRKIVRKLAKLISALHQFQFTLNDSKPGNFIVTLHQSHKNIKLWIFDVYHVQWKEHLTSEMRFGILKDLVSTLQSIVNNRCLYEFLAEYKKEAPLSKQEMRSWINRITLPNR